MCNFSILENKNAEIHTQDADGLFLSYGIALGFKPLKNIFN